ncbi:unnamed protein product [Fusarium graminearum]|nr:unnamed protein product [Fusarium graminearum]CAG2000710.1 unnamed protein product [Fusarium graminearum]VTO93261.1 unnamed protein product [Fusarium graminearum]
MRWYRKMMAVVKPENSIRNIVVTFAYSKFFIRLMAKCPKANILGMPLDEEPLTNVPLNSSMKTAAKYVGTDAHKLTTLALVGGFKILRSLVCQGPLLPLQSIEQPKHRSWRL